MVSFLMSPASSYCVSYRCRYFFIHYIYKYKNHKRDNFENKLLRVNVINKKIIKQTHNDGVKLLPQIHIIFRLNITSNGTKNLFGTILEVFSSECIFNLSNKNNLLTFQCIL